MYAIPNKKKMKCSNPECSHLFEYNDPLFGGINDPGVAVFCCPECGSLTKAKVWNVDCFDRRIDVNATYEPEEDENPPEFVDVPMGVFREYKENVAVQEKEIPKEEIWVSGNVDFEKKSRAVIEKYENTLSKKLATVKNYYLANTCIGSTLNRLEIRVKSGDRICRYLKEIDSEKDFNTDDLTLVDVTGIDLAEIVDGIYSRDRCLAILDNQLMKWRLECREVFFVSPFIGFQFKNLKNKVEVRQFWNLLGRVLDLKKTRFITRREAFNYLKKAYEEAERTLDDLVEWEDISDLVIEAQKSGKRKKKKNGEDVSPVLFFQKFHAKFYAGVYDDHVEVIVGSYNLHSGAYYENLSFKKYSIEKFERDYLAPFGVALRQPDGQKHELKAVIEIDADTGEVSIYKL